MPDSDCLFCRIASGELPSEQVYADDEILAFRDIRPRAPTHLLVIPRRHVGSAHDLTDADGELVGRLFSVMRRLADEAGLGSGYRIVTNVGPRRRPIGRAPAFPSPRRPTDGLAARLSGAGAHRWPRRGTIGRQPVVHWPPRVESGHRRQRASHVLSSRYPPLDGPFTSAPEAGRMPISAHGGPALCIGSH